MVVGSSNTDMVVTSARMPLAGETVLGNDFSMIPGGKGANQAVAAARAGAEVAFIAKTGADDFGRKAIEDYRKDGIRTDLILTDPRVASGVAMIVVDAANGQNSIVVAPGANSYLSPQDIQGHAASIGEVEVLLVQLEIPPESVRQALEIAKAAGVRTVLNPAPAQSLDDELLSLVDIITPNESETRILTGIDPVDDAAIRRAAGLLLEQVQEAVVITLGARGVFFQDQTAPGTFIPTREVQAIDTTAAGDVFNGYLAALLADGQEFQKAIRLANEAAGISVTRKGAQPSIPYWRELAG